MVGETHPTRKTPAPLDSGETTENLLIEVPTPPRPDRMARDRPDRSFCHQNTKEPMNSTPQTPRFLL